MDELTEHLTTLGLSPKATLEEAEAAYRDLIRVWHPDRFVSDPKLRSKAEAQTVRINTAMKGVRDAFKRLGKRPRPEPRRSERASPPIAATTHRSSTGQPRQSPPTLVIHQPHRASIMQALSGCAVCYFGSFLLMHFSQRSGAQTALGLVLTAFGFSIALQAVAVLGFKAPIIAVNRRFLHILGAPTIPLAEVVDANVMVSSRGTSLTILCSPEYIRELPILSRWSMRIRRMIRGAHFELNSALLDADPSHVIQMLTTSLQLSQESAVRVPKPPRWAAYTNPIATLCLAFAMIRCLGTSDYQLISLMPYLVLFALLRSAMVLQTTVLDHPSRLTRPN